LKELFKDSNVKISAHGFPEGDLFQDEPEEVVNEPEDTADGDKTVEALENIRNFPAQTKRNPRLFKSIRHQAR
jgi:hypothetical protein